MGELRLLGCELRNKLSNQRKHAMTFSKYLPPGVDYSVRGGRSGSEGPWLLPQFSSDLQLHLSRDPHLLGLSEERHVSDDPNKHRVRSYNPGHRPT